MNVVDAIVVFAELLGGLAFFLYGMSAMSGGLEKMAGGALERTLKKVTRSDFLSFFLGAGITVAIQSSSAMTVMLVGLVNSGIMAFSDTFGMIMGSHVGTTLTAWILTLSGIGKGETSWLELLKPTTFAPILAFIGIVLRMLSKKEKRKNLGVILIGFAVLMLGMEMMSTSMSSFRDNKTFISLLTAFSKSPFLAFAVSTLFTGIIQSSAATVAIVQALALAALGTNNPITYQLAIPLVLGANVGTCMTALISAIGTKSGAKRVVAMHIYTNAIGGVVCVALMYVVRAFTPVMNAAVGIVGIAVIHSLFNIINTIVFVPFKKPMIKLCEKTIKDDSAKDSAVFLDERIFNNPPLAVSECRRLVLEMAEHSKSAVITAIELIDNFDQKKSDYVIETESLTDKYEDKLSDYLVRISGSELGTADSNMVGTLLHSIGDFERIGDHALNIRDTAEEIINKEIVFSKEAKEEIQTVTSAVLEIMDLAIESFKNNDADIAVHVEPLEEVIDELIATLKNRHIERLQRGECTVQLGFVFTDLLTNYERISDHCSNIAVYALQGKTDHLDPHSFLNKVKSEQGAQFKSDFDSFDARYKV